MGERETSLAELLGRQLECCTLPEVYLAQAKGCAVISINPIVHLVEWISGTNMGEAGESCDYHDHHHYHCHDKNADPQHTASTVLLLAALAYLLPAHVSQLL